MANLLAGLLGAVVGLLGVVLGAVLNGRRDDRKWLRDQKLRGAVDFLTASGELYDKVTQLNSNDDRWPEELLELRNRMQSGRSVLLLLCTDDTISAANELAQRVWAASGTNKEYRDETLSLVKRLTRMIRSELTARGG
jgi:hypothetical protein